MEVITKESWKNEELPDEVAELSYCRIFSEHEYSKLILGLKPQQMEDKWFVYHEKDYLFLHRSWTGFCIYRLRLGKVEQGYTIEEVLVNRDEEQYNEKDNSYDVEMLDFLISNILLGESKPFPKAIGVDKPWWRFW